MLWLAYCSFYSQEIFACLVQTALMVQKWAWLEENVGVVGIFVLASRAVISMAPSTFNMFLCLCPLICLHRNS